VEDVDLPAIVGDLTLPARPATAEVFAPFGRLLAPGARLKLALGGGVLLALDHAQPGPRRVTHLVRYPHAKRVLLPMGPGTMLLVVLPPGERPGGPPAAFLVPPGSGVMLNHGVWHAGPVPLAEMPVCELLETTGAIDRMDRRPLSELVGAEAARVVLPEESVGRPPRFHLQQPNSVLVDPVLSGRLRLALVALDDLQVGPTDASLVAEGERLSATLRSAYGAMTFEDIPGVAQGRALFRALDLDPTRTPPACEALLELVLDGRVLPGVNAFVDTLSLCALRMRVPLAAYDADRLGEQILVRVGAAGESYPGPAGRRVRAEGRPVLSDREGPFGGPAGEAFRARVGVQTQRALVALYLPAGVDREGAAGLLDSLVQALTKACGGREGARHIT